MLRVGIDVGGTFTDLVGVDDAGRVSLAKSASTPADPSIGVVDGLVLLAAELGTDLAALLADTGLIVHGTTVATNALLERKGAKVGMLTTSGHRDVIEMREGLKDDRYNLRMAPPVPLVPRARARSRCATCTPTAIPATSGRPGSSSRACSPTPTCRSPPRCSPRSRSTSVSAPRW